MLPVAVSSLGAVSRCGMVSLWDGLPVDWWPLDVLPVCEPVPWSVCGRGLVAVVSVGWSACVRWDVLPVVVSSLGAGCRSGGVPVWVCRGVCVDGLPVGLVAVVVSDGGRWDVPPVAVDWWPWSLSDGVPWSVPSTPCQR